MKTFWLVVSLYFVITTTGVFGLALLDGHRFLRALGAGLLVFTVPLVALVVGLLGNDEYVAGLAAGFSISVSFLHAGLAAIAIHIGRAVKGRKK